MNTYTDKCDRIPTMRDRIPQPISMYRFFGGMCEGGRVLNQNCWWDDPGYR